MSEAVEKKSKLGWIAGLSAIAAFLTALGVNQFFPDLVKRWTAPTSHELLFNGFYRELDAKGESTSYLRFYPDGQVIQGSVLSSANAGEVVSWFGKNHNVLSKGSYVLTPEGKLEFATQSMMGEVSYQGSVAGNALHLNSKSRINGYEAEKDYEFMSAPGIQ